MNIPRAGWTSVEHRRLLLRLLEDLVRQAQRTKTCHFDTAELITAHTTRAGLAALRVALDQLHDTAEQLRDAGFNYRRALDQERKRKAED